MLTNKIPGRPSISLLIVFCRTVFRNSLILAYFFLFHRHTGKPSCHHVVLVITNPVEAFMTFTRGWQLFSPGDTRIIVGEMARMINTPRQNTINTSSSVNQ